MSVTIESVTISSITEKRLVLSNAQWAATVTVGSNWDRLRVACRMCLDDPGISLGGNPGYYLGVVASPNSGFANGPLSGADCNHFLGYRPDDATWTRLAGPPVSYDVAGNNCIFKKVGATETQAGTGGGIRISAAPSSVRDIYAVEIEKGSPNFTVRWNGPSGNPPNDRSFTSLLNFMDNPDFANAVAALGGGSGSFSTTIAVDESTDGFFNAIAIAWDRTVASMHISEMVYGVYE